MSEKSSQGDIENKMSFGEMLSLLSKGLLKLILYSSFVVIFLHLFTELRDLIFEHGEGWHDLDTFEIIFLPTLAILITRFFSKCKEHKIGYWAAKWRFIYCVVLYDITFTMLLLLLAGNEKLSSIFQVYYYEIDSIYLLGILLVVFAMPPLPVFSKENKKEDASMDEQTADAV